MRVLVTGATNPHGESIVRELARRGHNVRAFGVDIGDDRYAGEANIKAFPGWVEVGGSIEPVLAEREAMVHAACMEPAGRDKKKAAVRIEKGTLYATYAAEREQVDHFLHITPRDPSRAWSELQQQASARAEAARGDINVRVVTVGDDVAAAGSQVADLLESLPMLGAITGGHTNAVTA